MLTTNLISRSHHEKSECERENKIWLKKNADNCRKDLVQNFAEYKEHKKNDSSIPKYKAKIVWIEFEL